ncbi:MAG: hypothetical protein ACON35_03960 [Candidatus Marinamargulisbacteria bacterium]
MNKIVAFNNLEPDTLNIITSFLDGATQKNILKIYSRTFYRKLKSTMTNGRGYSYLDIQLMRAFFFSLFNQYRLRIQKPLLRAFLPELQKIESAFLSEQAMTERIEAYYPLAPKRFKEMSSFQNNIFLRLSISDDWQLQVDIKDNLITGLTVLGINEHRYNLPSTTIVQLGGNLMITEADGSTSCEDYRIGTKIYKNYRMDKKGVLTADLISYQNGEIRKNWFEDKKGVLRADRISFPNGEIRKNWRKDENGVITCKLRTFPNGRIYKNFKKENGIITYDLMSFPNGEIRKNFREDERGVQTAEQITYPNREICKNWRKDENGVITFGLLTYPNGRKHKNWRIYEKGVQTAEQITYPSGRKYENWSQDEKAVQTASFYTCSSGKKYKKWRKVKNGIATCELIIYPNGEKYRNWRKDEKGVETYEDENGDRKLVPIQDDGPPAKKRRKVGA